MKHSAISTFLWASVFFSLEKEKERKKERKRKKERGCTQKKYKEGMSERQEYYRERNPSTSKHVICYYK